MSSYLPQSWQDYLKPDPNPTLNSLGTANYLKIRVYLYKFTPPIELLEAPKKGPVGNMTAAYQNLQATQKKVNVLNSQIGQNDTLRKQLQKIYDEGIKFSATLPQSWDFNTFHAAAVKAQFIFTPIKESYETVVPAGNPPIVVKIKDIEGRKPIEDIKQNYPASTITVDVGEFKSTISGILYYIERVFYWLNKVLTQFDKAKTDSKKASDTFAATQKANYEAFKIQKFKCNMNPVWFSRYDISEFVSSYSFNQQLNGEGYSWNVNLIDRIVPFDRFNNQGNNNSIKRPVYFPKVQGGYDLVKKVDFDTILTYMSQYKSDADNEILLNEDAARIESTIRLRGIVDQNKKAKIVEGFSAEIGTLLSQLQKKEGHLAIDTSVDGIYLSDLISKYDFITAFVYNNEIPPTIVESVCLDHDPNFFDKEPEFLYRTLQRSPVLKPLEERTSSSLNPSSEDLSLSLYDVEFNGFIHTINPKTAAGNINTFTISGNGGTMLFGATRFIIAPTIYNQNIYDVGEIFNVKDFTHIGYEHNLSDKSPAEIIKFLLQNFFQIVDNITRPSSEVKSVETGKVKVLTSEEAVEELKLSVTPLSGTAIDMQRLQLLNEYPGGPRLLFLLPIFLYACVMRQRKFNIIGGDPSGDVLPKVQAGNLVKPVNNLRFPKENPESSGGDIFETYNDFDIKLFKTYFLNLRNGMSGYNPSLKTAWEVIKDIRDISYLEFFETPGGRLIFRIPQYNNITPIEDKDDNGNSGELITSNKLKIIATDYSDSANGLITRQQLMYGVDILGQLIPQNTYFYTNGKLLSQYGLMVSDAKMNPNARPRIKTSTQETTFLNGMFEYCKFFLEFSNMKIKTGKIRAVGDPLMRVGRTFYDSVNNKFGYVTSVSKSLTVGQTYEMTFSMIGVRDAIILGTYTNKKALSVKPIAELINVLQIYGNSTMGEPLRGSKTTKTPPNRDLYKGISHIATEYSGNSSKYNNISIIDPRDKRTVENQVKEILKIFFFGK